MQPQQFLLPGFIDVHIHAPQYPFAGTGSTVPLMAWLEQVASPGVPVHPCRQLRLDCALRLRQSLLALLLCAVLTLTACILLPPADP